MMEKDPVSFLRESTTFAGISFNGSYQMSLDCFQRIYNHYCITGENLLDAFSIHTYLLWDFERERVECDPEDYCFRYSQLRRLKKAGIIGESYRKSKAELINQVKRHYRNLESELAARRNIASAYVYKKSTRDAVFKKMGVNCIACGCSENIAIDHIVPVAKGGKDEIENLQPLCVPCNSSKGTMDNDAFMKKMKKRILAKSFPSTGAGKGAHPEVYQADSRSVDYSEGLTK